MSRLSRRTCASLLAVAVILGGCRARDDDGDTADGRAAGAVIPPDTQPSIAAPDTTTAVTPREPVPGTPARRGTTPSPSAAASASPAAPPAPMSDTIRRTRPSPPTKRPGGYTYIDSAALRESLRLAKPRPPR